MNFMEIAQNRQSCRNFDQNRQVEKEKLDAILEAVRLAPSACNGQPYHITVCHGQRAREAAAATVTLGMNKFAKQAPLILVFSEAPYVKTAAFGAKVRGIDYRSIDIGIAAAYLTAEATVQGVGSCILGWVNDSKLRKICGVDQKIHLVVALGYPKEGDKLRKKVRKEISELVTQLED